MRMNELVSLFSFPPSSETTHNQRLNISWIHKNNTHTEQREWTYEKWKRLDPNQKERRKRRSWSKIVVNSRNNYQVLLLCWSELECRRGTIENPRNVQNMCGKNEWMYSVIGKERQYMRQRVHPVWVMQEWMVQQWPCELSIFMGLDRNQNTFDTCFTAAGMKSTIHRMSVQRNTVFGPSNHGLVLDVMW